MEHMLVERLLNQDEHRIFKSMYRIAAVTAQKTETRKVRKKNVRSYEFEKQAAKCDAVAKLAKSISGLSTGQIWKGDVVRAQKDLPLVPPEMKINRFIRVTAANALSYSRTLKLCPAYIYWLNRMALLYTGAMAELIPTALLKKIADRAEPIKEGMTVASDDHANCTSAVKDDRARSENATTTIEFLAVDEFQSTYSSESVS